MEKYFVKEICPELEKIGELIETFPVCRRKFNELFLSTSVVMSLPIERELMV